MKWVPKYPIIGHTHGGKPIAAWWLKGNPNTCDIDWLLENSLGVSDWSVMRNYRAAMMEAGQPLFLQRTDGVDGALVGTGFTEGEAYEDLTRGRPNDLYVPTDIGWLDNPVPRAELLADPVIAASEMFGTAQQSNPVVITPNELDALYRIVRRWNP